MGSLRASLHKGFTFAEAAEPRHHKGSWSKGFTLAEVLITLGIIGVVAALTIPTLIQKYTNKVVETRLVQFYSSINQAVKLSEIDNGDKKLWYKDVSGGVPDKDGNLPSTSDAQEWFETYLAPYMKISKIGMYKEGSLLVYFNNGSILRAAAHTTRDWYFFPGDMEKCLKKSEKAGACLFYFSFNPASSSPTWKYAVDKGFETMIYLWDGTKEQVENICLKKLPPPDSSVSNAAWCSRWIQLNNWKIPENYPYKVSY